MMRGLRTWRHLLWNTTHPVLVITDHANLQYYWEPQKLGPRVNSYLAEFVTGSRERVWERPLDRGKLRNRPYAFLFVSRSCLCHELMSLFALLMRSFVLVVVFDCAVSSAVYLK